MNISDGSSPNGRTSPPRKRLRLTGPSVKLDPTRFLVRGDIASLELADRVFAPHYAAPVPYRVIAPTAVMQASDDGARLAELAVGERFDVVDISGGWAWGQNGAGGVVGYVRADALCHP